MSWRIVVISTSAKLDYSMGYMVVRRDTVTKIHINEIHTVMIETTAVSMTAALLSELTKHKVKVIFCDEKRNPSSELIPYYGSHDFNSKRIKTKLLQLVKEEADEYFYDIFIETKGAICQYAENILDKMMYSVSYDMNIDTMSLIKFLDVRVDIQTDKLIDSLIEYIKLLHDLCKIEVVVLVNIKTYLSQKELLYLYQETLYQKVHLILLEATLTERIDCETIVIIDADKCVIHI